MVLGENGLINKSKTSVGKYENAQENENYVINEYDNILDIHSTRDGVYLTDEQYNALIARIDKFEPVVLYSSSGTTGNFTLSKDIEEFEHIEIIYHESAATNGKCQFYLKATPTELNAGINLSAYAPINSNSLLQFFSCKLTINGKNAVRTTTSYAYNTFTDNGQALITVNGSGNIAVSKVIGYYY